MPEQGASLIASLELLPAAPAFVTRTEKVKHVTLNQDSTRMIESRDKICIPNPVYPSTFASRSLTERQLKSKAYKVKPPLGFKNDRNACHLNSVISAILSLPVVQQSRADLHTECKKPKNCGMCAFKKLFDKFMPSEPTARPVTISSTSFGKLFAAARNINSTEENDATQVLMELLLFLRREEMASVKAGAPSRPSKRNHSAAGDKHRLVYDVDEDLMETTTAVGRYFSFIVEDTLFYCPRCEGENHRHCRQIKWSLPVYLGDRFNDLRLYLLEMFCEIDSPRLCERCLVEPLVSRWDLEVAPRCLIVQIIPTKNLAERPKLNYLEPVCLDFGETYSLVAAVCVQKARGSGSAHYYCLSKRGTKGWLLIDDDSVRGVTEAEAQDRLIEGAHLLFMENHSATDTLDQVTDPCPTTIYESTDCPLAEQMRVTDKNTQQVTGVGLNQPISLVLKATID